MAEGASSQRIYGVLLRLDDDILLLPNVGIAEVTSHEGLVPRLDAPPWLDGMLVWQGTELPVIRFELLNGSPDRMSAPAPAVTRRKRVAVVNGVGQRLVGNRFGILCEGHPHLVTLNRSALRRAEFRAQDRPECVLSRVLVAGTDAAIPNLEGIEGELAKALRI